MPNTPLRISAANFPESPKFDELLHPILHWAADKNTWHRSEIIQPLGKEIGLTAEQMAQLYPTGNQPPIFTDRISWAISLLYRTGFLERPQRAYYCISDIGREHLSKSAEELRKYIQQIKEIGETPKALHVTEEFEQITPKEQLSSIYQTLRKNTYDEILDTILGKTPAAFEHLVVQLLQRMGYGGEIKDATQVTQQNHDGGIDGIIKEDVLGFGRIYIQAKRYQMNTVIQRPDVQAFAGALGGVNANKGVFITTARFSEGAIQYVQRLGNAHIVLIDGTKLAEYIYDYNLGMQTEQTLYIKKPDGDFWDELQDDTA